MTDDSDRFDRIDRQLLALLQSDARLTYEELGNAVGLSTAAAFQRVRKLEEAGVLVGYHGRVDPSAVGRPLVALVRVRPGPTTDVKDLVRSWEQSDEVLECHAVASDGAYILKLRLGGIHALKAHLDLARRSGCAVSADVVVTTAFERWTVPVS